MLYIYIFIYHLLHVSGSYVPIISRNDCIYVTLGTKCHINTVISPDDGHIAAQNMYRVINILRNKHNKKKCAPIWLYLQDAWEI